MSLPTSPIVHMSYRNVVFQINQMIRYSSVKDAECVDTYNGAVLKFLSNQETFHNSEARVCDNLNLPQACCLEGRGR